MMQLRYSPTSPYVRKVMVTAIEKGLAEQIEKIPTDPWNEDTLRHQNPLCKVPALTTDDGQVLFDSPVICEYLDGLGDGPRLLPADLDARVRALRLQALADGLCDAAILRRLENARPNDKQLDSTIERQRAAMQAGLDWLEANLGELDGPLNLGQIAVACMLSYFDLRWKNEDFRHGRPRLADWHQAFNYSEAMQATAFPAA